MKRIILLLIFVAIIIIEMVCANNFKNDLNRKIGREDKNKKANVINDQLKESIGILNNVFLDPLNMFKKIFFYKIFGFFRSYLIFIILLFCFLIGSIRKALKEKEEDEKEKLAEQVLMKMMLDKKRKNQKNKQH